MSTETTQALAERVVGVLSTDARLPVNTGMTIARWPILDGDVFRARIHLEHGDWRGDIELTFHDDAPRVRAVVHLDPSALYALDGQAFDVADHNPPELHHLTRWSLLLHAVPTIVRRVVPRSQLQPMDDAQPALDLQRTA